MDQSLSGGSGNPFRMTLTLICSGRESSDMREIIIACVVRFKINRRARLLDHKDAERSHTHL